jgi:hypothetical protein
MAQLVKKNTKGAVGKVEGPSTKPVSGIVELGFEVAPASPGKGPAGKYPHVEGAGVEKLTDEILDLGQKYDAVAGPFKSAKQDMIEMSFPKFFEQNKGRVEAPSSMLAYGKKGGVRVTFKDKFTPGDKAAIEALLGADKAAEWFRQYWEVNITSDDIPVGSAPQFIAELNALMKRLGLAHALKIKTMILPKKEFAAQRHLAFDPETNLKIQAIVPQQASVSTKGVR